VFYNNVITKKNAFVIKTSSFFPLKMHVGEKIEIITAIVHTYKTIRNIYPYFGTIVHNKRASHYFNRASDFYQVSSPGTSD